MSTPKMSSAAASPYLLFISGMNQTVTQYKPLKSAIINQQTTTFSVH